MKTLYPTSTFFDTDRSSTSVGYYQSIDYFLHSFAFIVFGAVSKWISNNTLILININLICKQSKNPSTLSVIE